MSNSPSLTAPLQPVGLRLPVPLALFASLFSLLTPALHAISVGKPAEDLSPEAELASFTVLDGFEVSLWASEKDGLVKPISMRWDERGRLWVITAKSYPQPEPGEVADDKVLILEDTKQSGHADKVTVFADGLRMPMGLELAPSATWPAPPRSDGFQPSAAQHDGKLRSREAIPSLLGSPMAAYVGEGEKLWIMRDLDGDGHADVREVVFSGFGTGDVHQCINSFTWTPDGALMFSQGLHNYSNVTTPWGGRRLYGAGFWMYRPLRAQLTPYPTGFPLNAWGTVYDDAGQPFSVAGAAGMFWTTPLLVPQYGDGGTVTPPPDDPKDRRVRAPGYSVHLIEGRALPNQGQITKQGMLKYCGVDIPRNAHWPADMHGELVSGGFFENCIYRHKLSTDKANPSGYEATRQPDLLKSSSVAFRPVDVKFGPDGALYISDWYNPIIGHYQASFRHPDRDKTHGRIWRVVKKGSPLATRRELEKMDVSALLDVLEKGERWEQYQAQRLLMGKGKQAVSDKMADFVGQSIAGDSAKDSEAKKSRRLRLYAGIVSWFEEASDNLLLELSRSEQPSDRAFAARIAGLWEDSLKAPLGWFNDATVNFVPFIADHDPRVRLEAIVACMHIPKPESIAVALQALNNPWEDGAPAQPPYFDSFHERALELAVHALAPQWEPALREGKLTLPPKHLAWLLDKKSDGDTLAAVRALLRPDDRDTGSLPVQKAPPSEKTPQPPTGSQPVSRSATLDPDSRRALLLMLAKRGTEEDVAAALEAGLTDEGLLHGLADLVESQQLKAPANAESVLRKLSEKGIQQVLTFQTVMSHGNAPSATTPKIRDLRAPLATESARLIGLWKVQELTPMLRRMLDRGFLSANAKRAALVALARLNIEQDRVLKFAADAEQPYTVRLGAIEALSLNAPAHAATAALALMPMAKSEEDMRALLAPFLAKVGRMKPLVAALTATPCNKEAADLATRALIAMGRNEPELSAALNKILGRSGVVMPYDAQWVSSLANEATVAGNAKKGDEIFHRPALNCIACHSIGGKGGIIGPQLDAVGRGVPVELLVEAVMWPQRQIKEGYIATTVVLKDGRTIIGYKQKESDTELTLRDMATNALTTLSKAQIQTRTDAGSLMPDGLTASLSREELRDLIAYLASLGK